MKYLFALITLLIVSTGFSQVELRKSSLSSGGGSVTSGTLYMVYALEEIGVQEVDMGSIHLSEGFVGVDVSELVDIKDYGKLEGWQVYPNPVKDKLNLLLPEKANYEVYLFDLTGKQLWKKNIKNNDYSIYKMLNYKQGVYILTIVNRQNKRAVTIKLQKQ